MKKWLKSKICGSVNSAHHCSREKSNISAQKVKKKKKQLKCKTCVWETQNTFPKRTLSMYVYKTPFWRSKPQPLLPPPFIRTLYLWSDHHIKGAR